MIIWLLRGRDIGRDVEDRFDSPLRNPVVDRPCDAAWPRWSGEIVLVRHVALVALPPFRCGKVREL